MHVSYPTINLYASNVTELTRHRALRRVRALIGPQLAARRSAAQGVDRDRLAEQLVLAQGCEAQPPGDAEGVVEILERHRSEQRPRGLDPRLARRRNGYSSSVPS